METKLYFTQAFRWREFKSYYVVWKLVGKTYGPQTIFGLNRTMQYGNRKNTVDEKEIIESLNRTMQYGNKKESSPKNAHSSV